MPELVLVLVGIALRLRQYAAARSLWLDEAMLANTVVAWSVSDLVRAPLPNNQAAPPAVLALMRAAVVVLGPTERALRLLPCVAGIAAVVVAWRLAARLELGRAARCCLIGLVALSPTLVYYAAEAKQYAVDAVVALGLVHVALRGDGRGTGRLALAGALAPWLSHSALLFLPGVGLVRATTAFRRGGARRLVPLVGVAVVWAASAVLLVAVTRNAVGGNRVLAQFWESGFAPFPIRSAVDLAWYGKLWGDVVAMAFRSAGDLGPAPGLSWPPWLDAVVPALVLAGVVGLARRPPGRRAGAAIVLTVATALIASAAHQYPLAQRLLVFTVPLVFVLVAGAVEAVATVPGRAGAVLAAMSAGALVSLFVPSAVVFAVRAPGHGDTRGALAYVAAHAARGDQLAPTAWSIPAVTFYRRRFPLDTLVDAPPIPPAMDAGAWVKALRGSQKLARTWVLIGHRFDERAPFLAGIRALAPELDAWEGEGAGTYLFDFGVLR